MDFYREQSNESSACIIWKQEVSLQQVENSTGSCEEGREAALVQPSPGTLCPVDMAKYHTADSLLLNEDSCVQGKLCSVWRLFATVFTVNSCRVKGCSLGTCVGAKDSRRSEGKCLALSFVVKHKCLEKANHRTI